jgi:hypothetical protein
MLYKKNKEMEKKMETWMLCMLIAALGYIAFDHARLILRTRALEDSIDMQEYLP